MSQDGMGVRDEWWKTVIFTNVLLIMILIGEKGNFSPIISEKEQ